MIEIPAGSTTAAIQDAFNNAYSIRMGEGEHLFDAPIIVRPGSRVTGPGAIIRPSPQFVSNPSISSISAWSFMLFTNPNWISDTISDSDISFCGLTIKCDPSNKNASGIFTRSIDGVTIRDCRFENCSDAVGSMRGMNILVDHCRDLGSKNAAYDFWESPVNIVVQNCLSNNAARGIQFNAVNVMSGGAIVTPFAGQGLNLSAENNIIFSGVYDPYPTAIFVSPLGYNSTLCDLRLYGNKCYMPASQSGAGGIVVRGVQGFQIVGNTINGLTGGTPIVTMPEGSAQAIEGIINSNMIMNCTLPSGYFIYAGGAKQIISGNNRHNSTCPNSVYAPDPTNIVKDNFP